MAVRRRIIRCYELGIREPQRSQRTVRCSEAVVRLGTRRSNDVVLDDAAVSRVHLEIAADEHGYRLRDLGSLNGTKVDGVRANDVYLRAGATLRLGGTEVTFRPLDDEAPIPASSADRFGPLVGGSLPMRELYAVLDRAAPSTATVLIEGETGTGKELVARAVHQFSQRSEGPWVVFDCAAVPTHLIESALFGHEKGAFTGASARHIGHLEEADGGTLFLDELGELPLELQPKLLRALEQRSIRRVGGQEERPVDVRLVAATNRDLAEEVNRGAFREDLYYRLAVVRVRVPPLRERREDIRQLVEHFVRRACAGDAGRISHILGSVQEENWRKLSTHPWPGNVRQLRNMIERTLALSSADEPARIETPTGRPPPRSEAPEHAPDLDRPFVELKAETLAHFEEAYLIGQLERHEGNFSRAAAAAGIDRMYFKRLLKKYR